MVLALIAAWSTVGGSAFGQVASAPKPAPPAPAAGGEPSCIAECHQPIIKHSVRHVSRDADCSVCHLPVGAAADHKFAFPVAREDLCVKCHHLAMEKHTHLPVTEGKCMDCHDPHGSEHVAQLVADPNRDLCMKCHTDEFMSKKFVHGPVAVGACLTCHKSHSSQLPNLLLADANTLCANCHGEVGKAAEGVHVHKALDEGCVSCHDPHASDHTFQLREVAPALCLSCHKDQFAGMTTGAMVVHGAITQEGGCTTCHEPHASKLAGLQRTGEPDTCLKCHGGPLNDDAGKPLTDMAKLLAANPNKHGPIRSGHCTVCHDPHAGQKFRLLPAEYPAEFYAAYTPDLYELCFRCHSPELATSQTGGGVTQFRDGARNLHALHVNQEKGRTCRACHEVHASQRPAHIRESVPFGTSNWMLELNFKATEQGGSCAPGCHAPKTYTRPSAVLPAPKETFVPATAPAPATSPTSAPPAGAPTPEPVPPPAPAAPTSSETGP